MLTLYLIRHARADERGPTYPDDTKRPLIQKGFRQAQTLAKVFNELEIEFDHIFSSPYTRAVQTAQPLARCLKKVDIEYLETLAGSDYKALLEDIHKAIKKSSKTIALIGHEPYLSELAAYLLCDNHQALPVNFKKSAYMALSGNLEAGNMRLEMFVPYSVYKSVARTR
jgi:phosphohistidine phosphatase